MLVAAPRITREWGGDPDPAAHPAARGVVALERRASDGEFVVELTTSDGPEVLHWGNVSPRLHAEQPPELRLGRDHPGRCRHAVEWAPNGRQRDRMDGGRLHRYSWALLRREPATQSPLHPRRQPYFTVKEGALLDAAVTRTRASALERQVRDETA